MVSNNIVDGRLGFDVGQVPPSPVIITDPDKGKVKDLKPALQELVLETAGNKAYRVDEESETIGIQYVQLDGDGGKEYTMPKQRIATPVTQIDVDGDRSLLAHEYVMYSALRQLFAEIAREEGDLLSDVVGCAADSSLPDPVVSKARDDVSEFIEL